MGLKSKRVNKTKQVTKVTYIGPSAVWGYDWIYVKKAVLKIDYRGKTFSKDYLKFWHPK